MVFSNNAPSVPLLPGAQDRLSVMLQLGALMAGDPARYPPGAAFAIQTVGPRDADIWIFKVEEDEKLSLPAGEFTARKLTRNPRKPFDDKVELWLAPELGYLPVRIKQTQSQRRLRRPAIAQRGTDPSLKLKEAQNFTACAYKATAHIETGALIAI